MSTPQEDFQRDPYDFLSNNVVYPNINVLRQEYLLPDVGGEAFVIRPAPVIPVTVKKVPNANSTTGDVFALVRAGDKAPFPLRAYYLPYMQNKTCGGVLHKSAEWMFTAAMDGCTFGAGSVTADGVCLAVHANAASAGQGGRDEQRRQQDEQIATTFSTLGSSKTMSIAPSNYMSDGGGGSAPAKISATTFGKRSGDKWEFFVLRFTSKKAGDNQFARDYLHKGIIGATS